MTKNRSIWRSPENLTWLLFGAAVVLVYFFALNIPLLGPDEPRYAQVAREMFERGDWITPTLGGSNWFEKPALLYWLQIAFYSLFGVSEISARLGSALFGLGTIICTYLIGRTIGSAGTELSGKELKTGGHSALAKWIALVTATSLGLIAFSRGASFDIIITFPIAASLAGFFIWEQKTKKDEKGWARIAALAFFYVFIGIGLIAKGLIGIVFPFAIVTFYLLLSRRWPSKELLISVVWGTALSLLVAAIWYLPTYLTNGWEFIDEFFIQHHFQRYTSNKYKHPGPIWFFWAILPAMTIPWLPFFVVSVWKGVKGFLRPRQDSNVFGNSSAKRDAATFSLAWMLVLLVFFSISGSKLPGYILPALPPAALLTGIYIDSFVRAARWRTFLIQYLALGMLIVVTALLTFALPKFAEGDSVKHMIATANAIGYADAKIINMNTISQNVEFYGAGRLVRDANGDQWRFLSPRGIADYIAENGGKPVLVLVPHQFVSQLTDSNLVTAKPIERDAELTIVAVELKKQPDNEL